MGAGLNLGDFPMSLFLSTKLLFMLLITRTYSVDGQKLCVMSGLHNRIFPWCWGNHWWFIFMLWV